MTHEERTSRFQKTAWILAFAGLIPFVLIPVTMLFINQDNALVAPAFNFFRTYSAIILSFLGGVRWGYSLRNEIDEPENFILTISVLPALVAWATLLMPQNYNVMTLMILLLAFCAHGAWDSLSASADKLPKWFSKLRVTITLIVALCHVAVFFVIGGQA